MYFIIDPWHEILFLTRPIYFNMRRMRNGMEDGDFDTNK
jgi:hypothetical protein